MGFPCSLTSQLSWAAHLGERREASRPRLSGAWVTETPPLPPAHRARTRGHPPPAPARQARPGPELAFPSRSARKPLPLRCKCRRSERGGEEKNEQTRNQTNRCRTQDPFSLRLGPGGRGWGATPGYPALRDPRPAAPGAAKGVRIKAVSWIHRGRAPNCRDILGTVRARVDSVCVLGAEGEEGGQQSS